MSYETALVIGMGRGMGMALARRFGREGLRLGLIARSPETLEGYARELSDEGIEARSASANVGDAASLRDAIGPLRTEMGSPSVLLYNPSLNVGGRPSELDPEALVESFRINTVGALVAVQDVLPGMRARGAGTVLFTGGGTALAPASPSYLSLGIGKSGLRYLAHALAADLKDDGIHVATITIRGVIKEGTKFDPTVIAEEYARIYRQPREEWEPEFVYQ